MGRRLTEEEKNDLVREHTGIVMYMANRYRFVELDIEEIEARCYLGLAIAINKYEETPDVEFASIAFHQIKREIQRHYFRAKHPRNEVSFETPIYTGGEGGEISLGDSIEDDGFHYDEEDIYAMVDESLFEEQVDHKAMTMEYLLQEKTISILAEENNESIGRVRRTVRRGQSLIKDYLVNNDIISNYLFTSTNKNEWEFKKHEPILKNDFGKLKYLRQYEPALNILDISILMDTSYYAIEQMANYPTTVYIRTVPDDSIKSKADQYCIKKYPERIPSEVKVYEMV